MNTASGADAAQAAHAAPPRPASLVHKGPQEKVQGYRFPTRDYRQPAFYLITMTAHDRIPRFSTCAHNRIELKEDGRLVDKLWNRIAQDYPQIYLPELVIMPDHLHGIVRVKEQMEKPIGVPLRAFKSQVTSALRERYDNPKLQIWMPGYHDWAVWRRGSLNAYIQYIRDNPRRYCLRKTHPDLFRRINDLCLQGRLLILACRPPSTGATTVTRELCLAMNHWSRHIAKPAIPLSCRPCSQGQTHKQERA